MKFPCSTTLFFERGSIKQYSEKLKRTFLPILVLALWGEVLVVEPSNIGLLSLVVLGAPKTILMEMFEEALVFSNARCVLQIFELSPRTLF